MNEYVIAIITGIAMAAIAATAMWIFYEIQKR